MNEYDVSDYGIFSDAISSVSTCCDDLVNCGQVLNECKSSLNNESVFVGPICDSSLAALESIEKENQVLSENFSEIKKYFVSISESYQKGDKEVANILSLDSGKVISGTQFSRGSSNTDKIGNYLKAKGFNEAAICGILANIKHESDFNPNAYGDHGTSYGICQWHNSRWTDLKNYCKANNKDSDSLEGQLDFLVYELENSYPGVYKTLKNVPNNKQGAYDACYKWTVDFEIPKNKYGEAKKRGETAQSTYWSSYGVDV